MAAIDFATKEDLLRVESKLDRLLALVEKSTNTVTVNDIATMLGMSESYIRYSAPWLLPNNGISQYPGTKRWDLKVYEDWSRKPVKDREMEYKIHNIELVRRKYRKK